MKTISLPAILLALAASVPNPGHAAAVPMRTPSVPVLLVPYKDSWSQAKPRWRDIGNNPYTEFESGKQPFDYANHYADPHRSTYVKLTYDQAPAAPYFVGHIDAVGLKPNFCYQIKLVGKPVSGTRGFGKAQSWVGTDSLGARGQPVLHTVNDAAGHPTPVNGDDWANQQLGYAGRWWDDEPGTSETHFYDDYYRSHYPGHTIYGYILLGDFVTDEHGNADVDFDGSHAYHVTWASWNRGGNPQAPFGQWTPGSESGYGYGRKFKDAQPVKLFYEYEGGRPQPVVLKAGTYHCRMVLTEESFHNDYGESQYPDGGEWATVLVSEDFSYTGAGKQAHPDTDPANDLVFTIGGNRLPSPPSGVKAAPAGPAAVSLTWQPVNDATRYAVWRSDQPGAGYARIADALKSNRCLDRSAPAGKTSYYLVQAGSDAGYSGFSARVSAAPR